MGRNEVTKSKSQNNFHYIGNCIDVNSEDTGIESVVDRINTHCNVDGKCGYLDFIDGMIV